MSRTLFVVACAALASVGAHPHSVLVGAPQKTKQTTLKVFIIAGQSNAVGMAETNSTKDGKPQNGSLIYQVH